MRWTTIETDDEKAGALSRSLGLSPVIGHLLVQRGMTTPEEAEDFLRPQLAHLDSPFALTNLEAAVRRIEQAVELKQDVVVFGDYDVDGVTSTVQLVSLLKKLELSPRICVPLRLEEGYGLSREAIDRIFDGKIPELLIALDCGTNAHDAVDYLKSLDVDVIIVDHHQSKEGVPKECILVNPHVFDAEDAPWRNLCTAGLVFKLLHGLLKSRREADDPRVEDVQLKDYLDLVAMGTIADLVPLQGENRILSWFGLHHLRASERRGLKALAEVSGINSGQSMGSADISFKLGPRINACGRLADAALPIELLLSSDSEKCKEIAGELDEMNRERQGIERSIAEEAERRAEVEFAGLPAVVLFDPQWHPGVVGIVASRVSRRFHKPCVVLGAEGAEAKGSGRSVKGVNLVQAFQECADLLGHWGGHPMAAGISLDIAHLEAFTERFVEVVRRQHPDGLPEARLDISGWVDAAQIGEALLYELDRLQPFGQGNQEPLLGIRQVVFDREADLFGEQNYRFQLNVPGGSNGHAKISGVAWRMEAMPEIGEKVDLAVRLSWNFWRKNRYPQLTLVDWRRST
ncbi:MAG: single-stranded-DNA-specific exonuclease RecJ [Verrucomicrobiota bacterium]